MIALGPAHLAFPDQAGGLIGEGEAACPSRVMRRICVPLPGGEVLPTSGSFSYAEILRQLLDIPADIAEPVGVVALEEIRLPDQRDAFFSVSEVSGA